MTSFLTSGVRKRHLREAVGDITNLPLSATKTMKIGHEDFADGMVVKIESLNVYYEQEEKEKVQNYYALHNAELFKMMFE